MTTEQEKNNPLPAFRQGRRSGGWKGFKCFGLDLDVGDKAR
ncbi:hypothetical protein [Nitrobacter sp.]